LNLLFYKEFTVSKFVEDYLKKIDQVIEKGKYKDNWESLGTYPEPQWYRNAKFGIFIHWGVYSVPAFKSEWYPRFMYMKDSEVYKFHKEKYGDPKDFGYADLIPLFKAEKFNPADWAALFKESGAKYVMPVAEHHDGFQMYDSQISDWNALKMGPERDVLGELKTEIEKEGMVFASSSHRAENYWFFGGGRTFDSGLKEGYNEPYGWAEPIYPTMNQEETHNIYSAPASEEHLDDWLVRTCELVDKYQPKIVWFDWWIQNMSFKPYLKKFAAYYYNRSLEWKHGVAINYKYDAFVLGSGVFDIERGQLAEIRPRLWQNDTAVAKNSWGYTENNDFKNPVDLVCDLVDIASKNGCLLLNVGPKSDGTITEDDQRVLRSMGKWLKTNGESIYDTTFWYVFGEGPTKVPEGSFTDVNRSSFTSEDIRFTYKIPYVYANILSWPESGEITIKSMGVPSSQKGEVTGSQFSGHIEKIEILGFDNSLTFTRDTTGLHIKVKGNIKTDYPVCFKITTD
jgi:alpha-L-fucosidase